jgi:hypothetical protein
MQYIVFGAAIVVGCDLRDRIASLSAACSGRSGAGQAPTGVDVRAEARERSTMHGGKMSAVRRSRRMVAVLAIALS